MKPSSKGRKEGGREPDESLHFPLVSHTYFDFCSRLTGWESSDDDTDE